MNKYLLSLWLLLAAVPPALAAGSSVSVPSPASLKASTGAGNIGYIAPGAGTVATTVKKRLDGWLSIVDFGAVGDGVADDAPAFQAAASRPGGGAAIEVKVGPGSYLVGSVVTAGAGKVIWRLSAGVVMTGAGAANLPGIVIMERADGALQISDSSAPLASGRLLRIDGATTPGAALAFLSNDGAGQEIAGTDFVGEHIVINQNATSPRTWGSNIVTVKNSTGADNFTVGTEVSISNNTAQATSPGTNGSVTGFFASYIYANNQASAAFASGGLGNAGANGWQNGVWVDGLTTGGTGFGLHNAVGGNAYGVGVDLSGVNQPFSIAAIALGNQHNIAGKDAGGNLRQMIRIDNASVLQVSEAVVKTNINGALGLSGVASATSANPGGASALPGNPVGYITVTINGVDRKIPYWAQ